MHTFNDDIEKLSFLKKYNVISDAARQIPIFYYFPSGNSVPNICEVIGYEDVYSTWAVIVISVDNKLINIHSAYLADMRKNGVSYFEKNKNNDTDSYVVFDLETTGTNYKKHEIIEISALKVTPTNTYEFSQFVKIDSIIPIDIVSLTGITNEMIYYADTIDIVLPKFLRFIGNCKLVGHNIKSFDCYFINKYCDMLNLSRLSNEVVDTLYLSRQLLPDLENHKLSTLCEYFGIDSSNAHRALSDCYMCNLLYAKLLSDNENDKSTSEIIDFASAADSFQQNLLLLLDEIIAKKELPPNSLVLDKNKSKSLNISSISLCISEPPYPLGSGRTNSKQSFINIDEDLAENIIHLTLRKNIFDNIPAPLPLVDLKLIKKPKNTPNAPQRIKLSFPNSHPQLYDFIGNVTLFRIAHYASSASSFGCCSNFNKCSDLKKCVHENKLYSTSCMYRKRLENGNIFFGENRNID